MPLIINRLIRPVAVGLVFLAAIICQLGPPAPAQSQSAPDAKVNPSLGEGTTKAGIPSDLSKKNVLVLHSLESSVPIFELTDRGLRAALDAGGVSIRNQFFEYLDLARNPGPEHRKVLAELMRMRYRHRKIDVIVTMYPEALQFALAEGRTIFPEIPIVALYYPPGLEQPKTDRPIIQQSISLDIIGTFEIARKLVPDAKRVYVINGAHELDKRYELQTRRDLKKWETQLEFRYLNDLPLEEILATVSSAPPGTIIFFTGMAADVTRRNFTSREVGERLGQVSKAPVFGVTEVMLGHGIAGGSLISFEEIGTRAGVLTVDILKGLRTPENIPPFLDVPPVRKFDWRQVRHWNLNEDALPKGSIIVNREFTLWGYRYYIIGVFAFFVAETVLIIFLIVQRRRRKSAEDSLRKAEEKYRSIFEGGVEGIFETSPQGRPLTVNPAMARILGYDSPGEFISVVQDSAHQVFADPKKRAEYVGLLEKQNIVLGFEFELLRRDGAKIWASISGRRVCGPDGKTLYYSGFIEDISERKRTEDAFQEAQLKYRTLYESMRDAFVKVDMSGQIQEFNSAYQLMLGYPANELRRMKHQDLTPEEWHEFEQKIIEEQVLIRGYSEVYEKEYRKKDGGVFPVELRTILLKHATGRNSGLWAIVRDITERKRAEDALRQSEERFRQVAESVGDFIWEVDVNGLYRYTSPSVERILGYRPDELIGKKHFYDLFAPEVREELKAAAFKLFAAKESFQAFPNPNLSKEGKVVHLETSGVPVLDAAGNLTGYRGADTDVTDRKRADEELGKYQEHLEEMVRGRTAELIVARDQAEAANRAKSAFLAKMSHELRTPLTSILGIGQLMERDLDFPQKQRDLLAILSRSGKQLFELIDDVLEMSKIEAGQATAVFKTFDLHRFLEDLEEMMSLRAEKKGLRLIFERDPALPQYIQTDARKLRQILINLLGNAIKFTEKGRVTLRANFKEGMDNAPGCEPASTRLEFEVEDTGIGIAEEDKERIFEPFVQLNPGQEPSGGIGLGLAISRKFAALLGGKITLRSQVGRGSTFRLEIGGQRAEGTDIPTQAVARQVIRLAPGQPDYCLLIVDDILESRLLFRQLLEPVGFRILEAASGAEAVELCGRNRPNLIWMDIRMPGMDGYEASRRIREAESQRRNEDGREIHTPIIAVTAGVMEDKESSSLSWVFDDWVYKPFREAEVFDKIEKHLGVQFIYRFSISSTVKPGSTLDKAVLTPADLSSLPADWLKEFFQTTKKGRSKQLMDQIDRIRSQHADLAQALAELVRVRQFDTLISLTQEAFMEKANG